MRWTITRRPANASDPPLLVPWHKIGDISLGASKARVQAEYGSINHPYRDIAQGFYRLHGSKVWVTFDRGRVQAIGFTSPYYRTKRGFGVGSTIPLGPCHGSARGQCEHRWHGFVFNEWWKEKPCGCWTKVGLGPRSLPATAKNYLRPWFIIYVTRGRVSEFYFDLKFVD